MIEEVLNPKPVKSPRKLVPCLYCGNKYKGSVGLTRHEKSCPEKKKKMKKLKMYNYKHLISYCSTFLPILHDFRRIQCIALFWGEAYLCLPYVCFKNQLEKLEAAKAA